MSTVYIDMCICSKFTCENTSFICAQFVDVTNIKMHHLFYNLKACILYTYSVNALGIYKYRIVYIASRQRGIEKKKGAHTDTWESLPLTNVSACDWKSRTSACIPNSGTFVRACGEMKAPDLKWERYENNVKQLVIVQYLKPIESHSKDYQQNSWWLRMWLHWIGLVSNLHIIHWYPYNLRQYNHHIEWRNRRIWVTEMDV